MKHPSKCLWVGYCAKCWRTSRDLGRQLLTQGHTMTTTNEDGDECFSCECDNGHEQAGTVCRYCWRMGWRTFTPEQYQYLSHVAGQKHVSIAWVIRAAVDKLVAEETPLFKAAAV